MPNSTPLQMMRDAYPATIRSDRLRLRVKHAIRAGQDADAWELLKDASQRRALKIRQQIATAARNVRLDYLTWKASQEVELRRVFTRAYDELAAQLATTRPESVHAYVHRAHLLRNLRGVTGQEQAAIEKAMLEAAGYGQESLYASMLNVGISRTIGIIGPTSPSWGTLNTEAVKAVIAQPVAGIPFSRRIWRHRNNARIGIQRVIAEGVAQGKSVNDMLPLIRPYIVEPLRSGTGAEALRGHAAGYYARRSEVAAKAERYRNEAARAVSAGKQAHAEALARLAQKADATAAGLAKQARKTFALARAAEQIPSKGLYRSWRANAWRMLREETNRAYREGYLRSAMAHRHLVRMKWTLSGGHPKPDICDDFAYSDQGHGPGVYEVHDYPVLPHIGCLCYAVPVVQWDRVLVGSREAA